MVLGRQQETNIMLSGNLLKHKVGLEFVEKLGEKPSPKLMPNRLIVPRIWQLILFSMRRI